VVLVDDSAMAALNRAHRGAAGPTDVLSFPMTEGRFGDLSPDVLGDVVISVETARRQAQPGRGGLRRELALLLVHGMLHLIGYDHGTARERQRMWSKQRLVLGECGIPAPAPGGRNRPVEASGGGTPRPRPGRRAAGR
jgi:probable rRNA maturation factor